MIIGIGADLVDIRRIEENLKKYGDRFTRRLFTPEERHRSDNRPQRAASYAKRFAAKEAFSKALGTGIAEGVNWLDMGVVNDTKGRPVMKITGGALKVMHRLVPEGEDVTIHLSLTDDYPYAQAFVVMESRPGPAAPQQQT